MLERAARGIGKVDHHGPRGLTNVTAHEIEAMALVLAVFNVPQITPGARMAEAELRCLFAEELVRLGCAPAEIKEVETSVAPGQAKPIERAA